MNENRYKPSQEMVWRMAKDTLPEKPSRSDLALLAQRSVEASYDMSNPAVYDTFTGYLSNRGINSPQMVKLTINEGRANGIMIALSEVVAVFESVCIHVSEPDLVEAMLRSNIDAVAGDARMPYPVMELAYPEGIRINDKYQVSGTLIVDYKAVNFRKWFGDSIDIQSREGRIARFLVMMRLRKNDGSYEDTNLVKKFDETFNLSEGTNSPDINNDEVDAMNAHTKLAWGLFLYLQGVQKDKAMTPLVGRHDTTGVPARIARILKNQKHYSIIDLAAPIHRKREPLGGTHASPITHWRAGHIRTLRDERYERNLDGSLKTVWIRPVKIMADETASQPSERRL